ncbi:hypothetical protein CN188_33030 [Sinorhizobium meliloti]|uniref:hypothetical protein n=1 Tax=Rhizobium meliloti TaxID=382 RepID=UPI000FDB739A|nr:hypothetical protein [Sinorhizobium meliloti]RVI72448.1 hypothetical protein CN188_33030 [Sinorhizobium meliloti]
MEHVEAEKLSKHTVAKVWSVREYCEQHQLGGKEEIRLRRLFGRFATASELQHNAKRAPKWRY